MASGSRFKLSSSTKGRPILVVSTTPGAGTPVHTPPAGANDEMYIKAINEDTVAQDITLEWGGTAAGDKFGPFSVPAKSAIWISDGIHIEDAAPITAYAGTPNKIHLVGHANRITN